MLRQRAHHTRYAPLPRGCSSMVEPQPSKLVMRVRFPSPAPMDEQTFVDAHGVEIFTRWWTIDAPRGVVLISHGASEHSGRYDRFAHALNEAGFAAVALDHRGHGRTGSANRRRRHGTRRRPRRHRRPPRAAIGGPVERRRRRAGLPVRALDGLADRPRLPRRITPTVSREACSAGFPSTSTTPRRSAALLQGLADAGMRDQPVADLLGDNNAPFEPARTPFDWLSRDPDEVDRYIADPMCGDDNPLTYGYLIDLFDVVAPARDQLASITCPVFVIAGDHDPAAGMGAHATTLADALDGRGRRRSTSRSTKAPATSS